MSVPSWCADPTVQGTEQGNNYPPVRPWVVPKAFPTKILEYPMSKEHTSDLRCHRHTKKQKKQAKSPCVLSKLPNFVLN